MHIKDKEMHMNGLPLSKMKLHAKHQAWSFIFEWARPLSFYKGHFHWKKICQWETFEGSTKGQGNRGNGLCVIIQSNVGLNPNHLQIIQTCIDSVGLLH